MAAFTNWWPSVKDRLFAEFERTKSSKPSLGKASRYSQSYPTGDTKHGL